MKYSTHVPHRLSMAHRLFDAITDNISQPHDSVFAHITSWAQWLDFDLSNNLLFIVLEDSPHYGQFPEEYDYWGGAQEPTIFQDVRNLAMTHPEKTIVFMLQGNHYHDGYFDLPNVRVGKWFSIPEDDLYNRLIPVQEKDLSTDKIGIALNRQMRTHRLALCSLLYGMDLDRHCHISTGHLFKQLDKLPSTDFLDHNPWQYQPHNDHVKQIMQEGFARMVSDPANLKFGDQHGNDIYRTDAESDTVLEFDNISNFENNLRPLYRKSFVEIVANRLFCEPAVNIDEKFIHTVYAKNFPILISSRGTADLYRRFGFDLFDDIVDHDYDIIDDPIDRLYTAIQSNQHLFTESKRTIEIWNQMQSRFDRNIQHANNDFHKILETLTLQEANRCLRDFLIKPF